jgi:hypothetical protein
MMMMHPRACERESAAVYAAQQTGEPDATLAVHLRTCAACREAFDVARYMTRLAAETDALAATRVLPEPGMLWWKARLLQRWDAETRATAPVDLMQRIEVIGGLVAVAVLLLMFWSDMRGMQSTAHAGRFWPVIAGMLAPGAISSFIAGALLLVGGVALFTLRQLLVEE